MKKLIYLIVLIAILGLIVTGCIPVVPPAEQDELGSRTNGGNTLYVDDDNCPVGKGMGHKRTHFVLSR